MRIGFWHPFGSHADESREEILKRKSKEISENGWTLWSFQYRTPESVKKWIKEIEILKPYKVLVFCSDSPKAKSPKSETGYLNEYQYPGESFWRPIPDKIEIPHPLGSKAVATGFKVAKIISPIDYKKYDNNYEWFCTEDSQWRTDQVPTRPEYLIRPGGFKKLRKIRAILELDYPYIVHLQRNKTKNEPTIPGNLSPEGTPYA